jgi:uncharacterized coiled-coil DUF342 family protein
MKFRTEIIAAALRLLANDIQSPDNVPATCLREAADKLEEYKRERDEARAEVETRKGALLDAVEQIEGLRILRDRWYERAKGYEKERDEARAEVERLKSELHDSIESYKLNNLQPKTTRSEPSRLEIASMIMQGFIASSDFIVDIPKMALKYADALIAAAKEAK